jgi:hypothetical protein
LRYAGFEFYGCIIRFLFIKLAWLPIIAFEYYGGCTTCTATGRWFDTPCVHAAMHTLTAFIQLVIEESKQQIVAVAASYCSKDLSISFATLYDSRSASIGYKYMQTISKCRLKKASFQ